MNPVSQPECAPQPRYRAEWVECCFPESQVWRTTQETTPITMRISEIIPGGAGQVGLAGMVGEAPGKTRVETPVKTPAKSGKRLGEKWGKTRATIVEAMRDNPKVSARALAQSLGLSITAVEKNIQTLKTQGLVQRIGPAKGGHWKVMP